MKVYFILALFVGVLFQSIPKQADKPQPNQNDSKHPAEQSPKPTTTGTENVSLAGPSSGQKQESANAKPEQRTWCEEILEPVRANWPLLLVAVWGILVARGTLKAIEAQGSLMDGQLKEMQKARELENKILILQYRPKIVIRNAKALNFSFELGEPGECEIRFIMVNTGGSPARIATGGFLQLLSLISPKVGKIEIKDGDRVVISEFTLQPGQQVTVEEILPTGTINDLDWANFREGIHTTPAKFLYLIGTIYYLDDLNIPRTTGIHRKYDPKTETFEPQKDSESEYTD